METITQQPNSKQKRSIEIVKTIFRRLNCYEITVDEFQGEFYLTALHWTCDPIRLSCWIGKRGGKEWIDFPEHLRWKGWKRKFK